MSRMDALRCGAPGAGAVHLCVDMQRMFAEGTEWKMPWLERVLPNVISLTSLHPERTILTRFVPPQHPCQGVGMWRHYYEHWASMTIDQLGADMINVVPELERFAPPARFFDKHVYSPWHRERPAPAAAGRRNTHHHYHGGETDVCVLATVMGAIDWGFRVILVTDALCSSADETHDAMMNVYTNRFGQQVECVSTDTILETWRVA